MERFNFLPITLFDNSKGIIIRKDNDIYVLHDGSNDYLNSKSTNDELPSQLGVLLDVNFDITSSREDISIVLSSYLGQQNRRDEFIDLTSVSRKLGAPVAQFCDYQFVSSVDMFINEFLYGGEITASDAPELIENAFLSCLSIYDTSYPACNFCKSPRCLIDYLLSDLGLTPYEKEIMVINYLRATLNLSHEDFVFLKADQNTRNFAMDLYNLADTYFHGCNNIEILEDVFNSGICDVSQLSNEDYAACLISELVSEYSNEHGFVIVENQSDVPTNVTVSILPYSCKSFYLDEIAPNEYETTISNLIISYHHVQQLLPPKYKPFNFNVSLDISVTALPTEEKCDVQNILADVLNEAVQDVVGIFGSDRVYLLPNALTTLETDLGIALDALLQPHFPLGSWSDVPAQNFLGGNPPIPIIPGEVDDCCQ